MMVLKIVDMMVLNMLILYMIVNMLTLKKIIHIQSKSKT